MTIRKAVAADADAVRRIAEEAYEQYVAAIGRKPAPMIADFAGQIGEGKVDVAVSADGRVQGFVVHYPRGETVHLENVAVGRDWTGQGIGGALIAHCEAEARKAGFPAVDLYTNIKMVANHTLYPRLGYVETHRGEENGFHRIYYRKDL